MTVLLPTPPLPLATAMVRVREPGPKSDWMSWSRWRRRPASASRSSHDMASSLTSTVRPPAIAASACSASARIWLRRGQPAVVSTIVAPMRVSSSDDVADHAEVDDVALQFGVLDARESAQHVFVGHACLRGRIGLWCVPARREAQSAGADGSSRLASRHRGSAFTDAAEPLQRFFTTCVYHDTRKARPGASVLGSRDGIGSAGAPHRRERSGETTLEDDRCGRRRGGGRVVGRGGRLRRHEERPRRGVRPAAARAARS